MKMLSVNAGSSSLKFEVFLKTRTEISCTAEGRWERDSRKLVVKAGDEKYVETVDFEEHREALMRILEILQVEKILKDVGEIEIVAHRAVNGGSIFKETTEIDDEVLAAFEKLGSLAPLHNPANFSCAVTARQLIPNARHYLVFDTAFHSTIPMISRMYGLPRECYERGIQVAGFHGISHKYAMEQLAKMLNKDVKDVNIITCHLGNGSSISCIKQGQCIDTTMGMTPMDGVVMGTRCGHLDPGVYPKLLQIYGSIEAVEEVLNKKSGLLGISGISSDMRTLLEMKDEGNFDAALAVDKFVLDVRNYIGQFLNRLDYNVDAIVFTGGIGENSRRLVRDIVNNLERIGVKLSDNPDELTVSTSKVKVVQIKANEGLAMVTEVLNK